VLFAAQKEGRFDAEMIKMTLKSRKGPWEFSADEHPRPDITIEQLAKLPPVFKKNGTVTAGNSSVSGGFLAASTVLLCFCFLLCLCVTV